MENLTSTARKRQQSEEQDGILNRGCLLKESLFSASPNPRRTTAARPGWLRCQRLTALYLSRSPCHGDCFWGGRQLRRSSTQRVTRNLCGSESNHTVQTNPGPPSDWCNHFPHTIRLPNYSRPPQQHHNTLTQTYKGNTLLRPTAGRRKPQKLQREGGDPVRSPPPPRAAAGATHPHLLGMAPGPGPCKPNFGAPHPEGARSGRAGLFWDGGREGEPRLPSPWGRHACCSAPGCPPALCRPRVHRVLAVPPAQVRGAPVKGAGWVSGKQAGSRAGTGFGLLSSFCKEAKVPWVGWLHPTAAQGHSCPAACLSPPQGTAPSASARCSSPAALLAPRQQWGQADRNGKT